MNLPQRLFFVGSLVIGGCSTREAADAFNRNITLFTIRQVDVGRTRPVPQNLFSSHDRIAAVMRNTTPHDQVMVVEFLNADSGGVLYRTGVTVPSNTARAVGPAGSIPSGRYTVRVTGNGINPALQNFQVTGN